MNLQIRFPCPCCGFYTILERSAYEICPLCSWEDDGQDDHNADKVLGGPNFDYCLTEARENFREHLTMYRPEDVDRFTKSRVRVAFDGEVLYNKIELKKTQILKYALIKTTKDEKKQAILWDEIRKISINLIP